jgi:uncharacterized iron-regulated protein
VTRQGFATLVATLVATLAGLAAPAPQSYVPERVYDSRRRAFADFEMMLSELTKADVVFVGEQHDDPNTHRLELAILEGLARRTAAATVSLEMFERDVAEPLSHFTMGHLDEEDFLGLARPWPRYQTDYKPLVDFAIAQTWPVIAANVPRPIAAEVARAGLDALAAKTEDERRLFAADLQCPTNSDYFRRFAAAMGSHPGGDDAAKRQTTERYYFSQCLKDETMAESIARTVASQDEAGQPRIVVHFTGAFHSDFGQGTVERTRRRLREKRIVVISVLPVASLDGLSVDGDERKRADYLVYTARAATR